MRNRAAPEIRPGTAESRKLRDFKPISRLPCLAWPEGWAAAGVQPHSRPLTRDRNLLKCALSQIPPSGAVPRTCAVQQDLNLAALPFLYQLSCSLPAPKVGRGREVMKAAQTSGEQHPLAHFCFMPPCNMVGLALVLQVPRWSPASSQYQALGNVVKYPRASRARTLTRTWMRWVLPLPPPHHHILPPPASPPSPSLPHLSFLHLPLPPPSPPPPFLPPGCSIERL